MYSLRVILASPDGLVFPISRLGEGRGVTAISEGLKEMNTNSHLHLD